MHFISRIPLAWLQLTREKQRMFIALAGIAFANVLIFLQLGMLDALYDGASQAHRNLEADLIIVDSKFQTRYFPQSFPRERLQQVLSYENVQSVRPLYIDNASWRNQKTGFTRDILVWGIDPDNSAFTFPEININLDKLKLLDRILFDRASRPEYGSIPDYLKQAPDVKVEVNNYSLLVIGLFELGASFGADGNIVMGDSTFFKIFPYRQASEIDVGLVTLNQYADLKLVQSQLKEKIKDDVNILTTDEFVQLEVDFWKSQGVGFVFEQGVFVGLIVGLVIVYQILSSDVYDHLPEYATLKIIGYSNRYFIFILLQEALILALLGFVPGFLLSFGLYQATHIATKLPIAMKLSRAIFVLILTIVMCSVSGIVASRKMYYVDPADFY